MPLQLPAGKKIAVNIGADFDAHSVWMGTFGLTSPSYLSRGEFGAEVGVPRLLELFRRYEVRGTWCTPTHSMQTFPAAFTSILEADQEIAAHGCFHEAVLKVDPDEERRLMARQLELHEKYVGKRPRGYRSPAFDFTDDTMAILEENGFDWDSSLMGRDFEPYHPRSVEVHWEEANVFGPPSRLLEFPVSWFLDDFPATEYVPRVNQGLGSTDVLYARWKDHFDYAYAHVPNGVMALTVHPQTIGRAHHIMMLERLIDYMSQHDGVWFAPLSDIYDRWVDEE
jgi:peptidoglycan/xylan/chitin deacetylase (PgdA/CDA1 family)